MVQEPSRALSRSWGLGHDALSRSAILRRLRLSTARRRTRRIERQADRGLARHLGVRDLLRPRGGGNARASSRAAAQEGGAGVTFAKIPHEILRRADLSASAKIVFAAIADRVGQNVDCWPGVTQIAADCGLDRTTVMLAVARLESIGALIVERPPGNPSQRPNRYRIGRDFRPVENSDRSDFPTDDRSDFPTRPVGISDPNQTKEPDQVNQTKKKARGSRRDAFDPVAFAQQRIVGTPLDTAAFREAWADWVKDRRDRRKSLTPQAAERQLARLLEWGEAAAVSAIENSIANGWQGLFPPDAPRRNETKIGANGRHAPLPGERIEVRRL